MKSDKHKVLHIAISATVLILVLSLILYFIVQLASCSEYFQGEALSISNRYTIDNVNAVEGSTDKTFDEIASVAGDISGITGIEAIDEYGKAAIEKYDIQCLQFYKNGEAKFRYGVAVGSATAVQVKSLIANGVFSNSRLYTDNALGTDMQCIAVYSPVSGNGQIDGVVAYYVIKDAMQITYQHEDVLALYCVAASDGNIIDIYAREGFPTDPSHNIYTYLNNISGSKTAVEEIEACTKQGLSDAYKLNIRGEEYAASFIQFGNYDIDCVVINLYPIDGILNKEITLYRRLLGAAVGVLIMAVASFLAVIILKKRQDKHMVFVDEFDPLLGCNSYNKFIREAETILNENRISAYAVLCFEINKFSYLREHFNNEVGESTLRYVSNIIAKIAGANETYGHVMDERFVSLFHYSDMQLLGDRIKVIDALISNFEVTKSKGFTLHASVGVYLVERDQKYTITEMIDRATIAQKAQKKAPNTPYVIYDSTIRATYITEAQIESKMEFALNNHEFKVFFQPKYNINKDNIDGAEALVRWYDPKANTYIGPDKFVPLFEVNGFIDKLDRTVFIEVCKYMKEASSRGEKIVPISVNVSRVTATQPDFIQFYTQKKREYRIADGFLTIEFTESFAYENYETLSTIISALKKDGFHCSIDDFGAGYSSFNILKELQMDELKLDKFFLNRGTDKEKDETLLKTLISLGKDLGMKVTQEGVETIEQLMWLTDAGCNVIQGYYYSKPLPMSDFIDFVARDTSIDGIRHTRISDNAAVERQVANI